MIAQQCYYINQKHGQNLSIEQRKDNLRKGIKFGEIAAKNIAKERINVPLTMGKLTSI